MKYLKTFNESVFEEGDFFYKKITINEFDDLIERDKIVPDEVTMMRIWDLLKEKIDDDIDKSLILNDTGFYQFTIIHEDEDNLYISHLEDDWYLVEYHQSEFDLPGGGRENEEISFYICDGWEGLTKFVEEVI